MCSLLISYEKILIDLEDDLIDLCEDNEVMKDAFRRLLEKKRECVKKNEW